MALSTRQDRIVARSARRFKRAGLKASAVTGSGFTTNQGLYVVGVVEDAAEHASASVTKV